MVSFATTFAARPKPVASGRAPKQTTRAVELSAVTHDAEAISHRQSFEIVQTLLLIAVSRENIYDRLT